MMTIDFLLPEQADKTAIFAELRQTPGVADIYHFGRLSDHPSVARFASVSVRGLANAVTCSKVLDSLNCERVHRETYRTEDERRASEEAMNELVALSEEMGYWN